MSTSTSESPVGSLMHEAERRAKMKTSHLHTAEAPCGCIVTVAWISDGCQAICIDRCGDHALVRGKP